MSWYSKVTWSQGMFVQPQHFQQNTRYLENFVLNRCAGLVPYDWGIRHLKLDIELLAQGKIALEQCSGRFDDGTPFEFSQAIDTPSILDVPELQNTLVYLVLPLRRTGMAEIDTEGNSEGLSRFRAKECDVQDNIESNTHSTKIQVASLNLRLALETDNLGDYSKIAVCKIIERQPDGKIVLDETFVPPCLSCKSVARINGYAAELQKLLQHRAEFLAGQISDGARGASNSSEISDFLLLQTINRYEPLLMHLSTAKDIHPETLYQFFLQIAGELTTFTKQNRRPSIYPAYQHDKLHETFTPILQELRLSLGVVMQKSSQQLEVQKKNFGIFVSPLSDSASINDSYFILAAKSTINDNELRQHLPQQAKVGPLEQIRELVNLQLPGIGIRALSTAPRQIPYRRGYTYFELDKKTDLWKHMDKSKGFAFHIGGEFPDLELEFWAVKE